MMLEKTNEWIEYPLINSSEAIKFYEGQLAYLG